MVCELAPKGRTCVVVRPRDRGCRCSRSSARPSCRTSSRASTSTTPLASTRARCARACAPACATLACQCWQPGRAYALACDCFTRAAGGVEPVRSPRRRAGVHPVRQLPPHGPLHHHHPGVPDVQPARPGVRCATLDMWLCRACKLATLTPFSSELLLCLRWMVQTDGWLYGGLFPSPALPPTQNSCCIGYLMLAGAPNISYFQGLDKIKRAVSALFLKCDACRYACHRGCKVCDSVLWSCSCGPAADAGGAAQASPCWPTCC